MQQILAQLQQGTQETVKDHGDGRFEIRINPPTALNLRAARLIVQIINERDQVVNTNVQLNKQLHEFLQENENLKQQVKELHDKLNSTSISRPDPTGGAEGSPAVGKDETTGSTTS